MPSIVGSPIVVLLPTGASPGAQPAGGFTVPSGANLCLAFLGGSDDAGVTLSSLASNFTSSNFTVTNHPGFTGYGAQFGVAQINSSGSGKTITPVWSSGVVYGPTCTLVFMSVTDPATCIADLASEAATGRLFLDNSSGNTPVAGSVNSGATDIVFNYDCKYTTSSFIPGTPTGYTSLLTQADLGGATTRLSQANTPGSSTTSGTTMDTEYSSLIMAAVRDVGSSPQTVLPPLLTNTNTLYAPTVVNAAGPQTVLPPLFTNTNTLYAPTVRQIPVLSSPTAVGKTNALILAGVTTSVGAGTLYMVATVSATPPSAAQIMAGQDNTGATAAFAGNLSVSSTGAKSFNASGLAQLTTYNCFFYHDVGGGYGSNIVTAAAATFRDGGTGQDILDNTGPIGGNPAGILYNDVQAGDEAKWFSFVITTPPVNDADFEIDVLGRFTYVGPDPDEFYYQLEVDGANVGSPQRVELYDHDGAQDVSPPLLTNTQTFYGPTVLRGAVNVLPPLFTNTNTIYAPTVVPQAQNVAPPLLTNTQTFYGPTVVAGPLNVSPPLLTNTNTLYGPTVSGGTTTVIAPLLVNNQTFFGPTVVVGAVAVLPPLLVNTNTIFAPRVRHVVPPVPGEGQPPRLAIGIRLGL